MNTKRILVFTVLADAILSIASFIIDTTQLAIRDPDYFGVQAAMPDAQTFFFFGLLIVGWIGILCYWSPARYCYLAAWTITLFEYATTDSYKAPGWIYALYNIIAIVGGFLIALIFFSDLRNRFTGPSNAFLGTDNPPQQPT